MKCLSCAQAIYRITERYRLSTNDFFSMQRYLGTMSTRNFFEKKKTRKFSRFSFFYFLFFVICYKSQLYETIAKTIYKCIIGQINKMLHMFMHLKIIKISNLIICARIFIFIIVNNFFFCLHYIKVFLFIQFFLLIIYQK